MIEMLFNEGRSKRAVSNFGNPYRFLKLAQKAERGEEITFVTICGSITTSCNAFCFENHYGCLVKKWLKENLPNAKIKFVPAGIGATGSLEGVHPPFMRVINLLPIWLTAASKNHLKRTLPILTMLNVINPLQILNIKTQKFITQVSLSPVISVALELKRFGLTMLKTVGWQIQAAKP